MFLKKKLRVLTFFSAMSFSVMSLSLQAANLLDVYNDAVRSDPVSIAAQLRVLDSEAQQQRAVSVLYPQASLSGALSDNLLTGKSIPKDRYTGKSIKLNINQVLFDLKAWRENEKYKLLIDKSSNDYRQAQADLIVKVVERYFAVLEAQDTLVLTKKNTTTINQNLKQLRALYKRQLIPITGVYEAEARYDLARSSEIEANTALSVAFEKLYEVIAERVPELSPIKEKLQFLEPDDSVEDWLALALENNFSLAASHSDVLAAKKEVAKKSAGYFPRLNLGFTQSRQDTGFDNSPRPQTDTSTIAISFSQPIYQGGGISAEKRQSVYRLGIAEQVEIESKRKVEQQLREYYLSLKSDVLKIQATKRLIDSEKKRAESMKAGFKYGTVTVNDVLDADTAYLKAQLEHQKAKYKYIIDQVKLKNTAGLIAEKDIIELNNWVQ